MANPICTYDFTLKSEGINKDEVIAKLKSTCKKWCFQLEKADSGYEHYQGRVSLGTKQRLPQAKQTLTYPHIHLSPTSNENRDNQFYVTKDGALDGPWKDTDKEDFELHFQYDFTDKILYPWQQQIWDTCTHKNARIVNIVYDPMGGIGKTSFCSWMMYKRKAQKIPIFNDHRDIMRFMMGLTNPPSCFFLDLPRSISKDKLDNMYAGIESIKDGWIYDDRYSFKQKLISSPNLWVFTNVLPDKKLLSLDRWKLWEVKDRSFVSMDWPSDDNSNKRKENDFNDKENFKKMLLSILK